MLYRSYYGPDGRRRDKPGDDEYFGDYDQNRDGWKTFAAGVKKVTGKEFTSFQGVNTPKDETFVVSPKAK